jgi:Flp pilus assembly pilin Flp
MTRCRKAPTRSGFKAFVRNDDGQDLIEYGLLVGIITAVAITALAAIGPKVEAFFEALNSILPEPPAPE